MIGFFLKIISSQNNNTTKTKIKLIDFKTYLIKFTSLTSLNENQNFYNTT